LTGTLPGWSNGRGQAAESLASRGGRLDLEGAAGVGRLDLVKDYFNAKGRLKRAATRKQTLLVRAGAKLDPEWYEDDEDRLRALDKIRSDARMMAALGDVLPR